MKINITKLKHNNSVNGEIEKLKQELIKNNDKLSKIQLKQHSLRRKIGELTSNFKVGDVIKVSTVPTFPATWALPLHWNEDCYYVVTSILSCGFTSENPYNRLSCKAITKEGIPVLSEYFKRWVTNEFSEGVEQPTFTIEKVDIEVQYPERNSRTKSK
jgi:hypothetical protein